MTRAQKKDLETRKANVLTAVSEKLRLHFGCSVSEATENQLYKAVALTVRDEIMRRLALTRRVSAKQRAKWVFYLSVEFLMGRSLENNMINLLQEDAYKAALAELEIDVSDLECAEPEAALGNGGLGRLAACFIDSMATLQLPAMGCGIRYEYGLFKQLIVDGSQVEQPDSWLMDGNIWEVPCIDDQVAVHFGGRAIEDWSGGTLKIRYENTTTVLAVPYDTAILGYGNDCALTLRLWSAKSPADIDLESFSRGDYMRAMEQKELGELISKVLYPADDHLQGKMLRLKQHYFFTSATVQYIIRRFKKTYPGRPLTRLPEKVVLQINDTHPTLAIPEMMRILLDEEGLGWEDAWNTTRSCFAYTNHTVMAEALETWPVGLYRELLPRIYAITQAINEYYSHRLNEAFPGQWQKISSMSIIAYDQVRMANLAIALSFSVNGVSSLHGEILRNDVFAHFNEMEPGKIIGITNGITPRRWLMKINPGLCQLITEAIGEAWKRDLTRLEDLKPFADDAAFREKFAAVKNANKTRLAEFVRKEMGISVDPDALFDTQAKRLHEYKRQLLNALRIIHYYQRYMEEPGFEMPPKVFFFSAKAAQSYHRAKLIIRLIHSVAEMIEKEPRVRDRLRVVFIPNYRVSVAEVLIPGTNLSQQISTAGKEASGTSNMKFMLNGAVTIGTLDGANVEISQQVGLQNIYLLGNNAQQNETLYKTGSYRAYDVYAGNHHIKKAVDMLLSDQLPADRYRQFSDLYQALLVGDNHNPADQYLLLNDFESYVMASEHADRDFLDPAIWWRKAIINTASAGIFSSDRTISEYNEKIWHIEPLKYD